MKIKILTFFSNNFGAVMQAYALRRYLNDNFGESEIINYRTLPTVFLKANTLKIYLKNFLRLFRYNTLKNRLKKFESFQKNHLRLTRLYETKEALFSDPPLADVFVVGSDQVWNPIGKSSKEEHFLMFAPESAQKISYAASLGVSKIPAQKTEAYKRYLENMDAISVREKDGCDEIQKLTDKKVHLNIDPTFLLSKEQYRELEIPVKNIAKKFIYAYILYRPKWLNEFLRKIKEETGYEIIVSINIEINNVYCDKLLIDAGPQEFLWLVDHAEMVISSSFHGTAFSIIMEKPFYSIVNPAAPARISNLLNIFNLQDRLVNSYDSYTRENIDYKKVNVIKKQEQEKSKDYLNTNIDRG